MRKSLMLMGILDDSDIEWLATNGVQRAVAKGEVLIPEGRPIDALHILLDGSFAVTVGSAGKEPLAVLFSGEVVGEISFVDSRPPLASVTALENSRVLAIGREDLLAKMERDPGLAGRFYKAIASFLADRLRSVTGRLGYGEEPAVDPNAVDEMDEDMMGLVSLAAVRFDNLLKRMRLN